MANMYDNYVDTQYIPKPFEAYLKAGDAQQEVWNKSYEQGQKFEDSLAALPVRQVDIPGKNAAINKYTGEFSDLYQKYQKDPQGLQRELHTEMRKAAKDPAFNALTYSYNQLGQKKDEEKKITEKGKAIYNYHNDWDTKPSVDNKGNLIWNPEDMAKTNLGVAPKADYFNEAYDRTHKVVLPKLREIGITIDSAGIHHTGKDVSGKTVTETLPTDILTQGNIRTLNHKEQWVKDRILEQMPEWEQSFAGEQYGHLKGKAFDANTNNQQQRYAGHINDKGYEGAKEVYKRDSNMNLFLSTIPDVHDENLQRTIVKMPGAGNAKGPGDVSGSITMTEAFNPQSAGQQPSGGPEIAVPSYDPGTTHYAEFTSKDKADLYKYARGKYDEYGKDRLARTYGQDKGTTFDQFVSNYKGYDSAKPENPYGNLTEEYLKDNKKVADNMLAGMKVTTSTPALNKWAEKSGMGALNNSNTIVVGGKYNMLPAGNALGGSDISNYKKEFTGQTADIPTVHGGTKRVLLYNTYVTKDEYKDAGFDPDTVKAGEFRESVDDSGKKVQLYPLKTAVSPRNVLSAQAARMTDFEVYGPDKQIQDDNTYQSNFEYQSNIDKFNEFGYNIIPHQDAKGNTTFTVIDKHDSKKGVKISKEEMASPGAFELVFSHHNK